MKIQYAWDYMTIWEMLATLFPFRSKRYVMKWVNFRRWKSMGGNWEKHSWAKSISLKPFANGISISMVLSDNVVSTLPNPVIASGFSIRDAWDNMLDIIAKLENMRDKDELCKWLDTLGTQHVDA